MPARGLGPDEPLEEGMATTPGFWPGESRGQRSLGATVHGVAQIRTRLKRLCTHAPKSLYLFGVSVAH